ncbi:MAG TPA: DUF6064 family protein [Kiloniellaceae bacterium]|nr:DUF6064 family protein [Kiloniellaceae bacterium]
MLLEGSYSLDDFLLFSEEVYWRLFEVHNSAFWPLIPPALIAAALLPYLLRAAGDHRRRAAVLVTAAAWFVVAWSFFWVTYATINWAAIYVAPLFAMEGLLLLFLSAQQGIWARKVRSLPGHIGGVLLLYGLLLYPLQGLAMGRPVAAVQLFGLAPDPTALATLGLLMALGRGWRAGICRIVPVIWCLLSATTLYALGSWEAWPLAVAAALGVFIFPRKCADAQGAAEP